MGRVLAYTSLLPVFVGFGLGCVALARREITAALLLLGLVCNEGVNWGLKHAIKQPRHPPPPRVPPPPSAHAPPAGPSTARGRRGGGASMGCPQAMRNSCASWPCAAACGSGTGGGAAGRDARGCGCGAHLAGRPVPRGGCSRGMIAVCKSALAAGLCAAAGLVGYSRVYLKYHTAGQVLVGCLVGAVTGALWWLLVHARGAVAQRLESTALAKALLIRDRCVPARRRRAALGALSSPPGRQLRRGRRRARRVQRGPAVEEGQIGAAAVAEARLYRCSRRLDVAFLVLRRENELPLRPIEQHLVGSLRRVRPSVHGRPGVGPHHLPGRPSVLAIPRLGDLARHPALRPKVAPAAATHEWRVGVDSAPGRTHLTRCPSLNRRLAPGPRGGPLGAAPTADLPSSESFVSMSADTSTPVVRAWVAG